MHVFINKIRLQCQGACFFQASNAQHIALMQYWIHGSWVIHSNLYYNECM